MNRPGRHLPEIHSLPGEHKRTQPRPDNDTNNNVSIIVHSQQHDKVCNSERNHVQRSADHLLEDIRPERRHASAGLRSARYGGVLTRNGRGSSLGIGANDGSLVACVLTEDEAVVLFA